MLRSRPSHLSPLLLLAVLSLSQPTTLSAANCDPEILNQAMQSCGMDMGCILQATNDYNAQCMGATPPPAPPPQQPASEPGGDSLEQRLAACGMDLNCINREMQSGMPQPPSPPGGGGGPGDMMQRMLSCGGDPACYEQIGQEMQQGGSPQGQAPSPTPGGQGAGNEGDDEILQRLREQTVLPASWLQTYQNTLINCGDKSSCWEREVMAASRKPESYCGTNILHEPTMICRIAAAYEVQIEAAIAQQILLRRGVRVESGSTPKADNSSPQPAVSNDPGPSRESFDFLPEVSEGRVRSIIERWLQNLKLSIPAEGRQRIDDQMNAYPLQGSVQPAPLLFEQNGDTLTLKPTRRDWGYAMTGSLLTQAAFMEQGARAKQLLDVALWCFLRAADLNLEAEHLSNVGFHLNLKAKLEEARDILIFARNLDARQPDAHNNLAFSLSAMGKSNQAEKVQQAALALDPGNPHIRSRYQSMVKGEQPDRPNGNQVPPGWDFGEAYFRLGKRHTLREYWAGKAWHKAQSETKSSVAGGYPEVSGPHEWYQERIKDIANSYDACTSNAPKELRGCPFGPYVDHPSCRNAASPAEVERSIHNRKAALCRCRQTRLLHSADAINAYLDRAPAIWSTHEKKWWPILQDQVRRWRPEIRSVNSRYPADLFQFPEETGYALWPDEFKEDSERFWERRMPDWQERYQDLKSTAQSQKACKSHLPPPRPIPEKPKLEKKTVRAAGMNLGVVEFLVGQDLSFKFKFDLGFIKGGYEMKGDNRGHKYDIGTGPLEVSYETNNAPGPGGDRTKLTTSVSLNIFDLAPGPIKPVTTAADQVFKMEGKYEIGWGNRSGFDGRATTESRSKFGIVETSIPVPAYTRSQN